MANTGTFTISVVGELSGETFRGEFEAVKFLSYRQQLLLDSERRRLIGDAAGTPSDNALTLAHIFSNLNVRLVKFPSWWVEAKNGVELVDENVVLAVFEATMKVQSDAVEEVQKRAAANKEAIKPEEK